MSRIETHIDTGSDEFRRNAETTAALEAELREKLAAARGGGGERSVARQRQQGKLLARERIERLLDGGSAFLEIGALAAHDLYDGAAPGAGIVTGIGRVSGREVMVVANDATVKGGTWRSPSRTTCPASTSWTRAARSCRSRPRSSRTGITSGASSTTRRA